jgi:predicted RNA binding protein YcfA (HicA-like mRNA interferase family)
MPRFPILSGAEVVKALERMGFEQVRQRGSHVVMRRDEGGCVVPLHKEVKRGTLAGILRQAQISADDFLTTIGQ